MRSKTAALAWEFWHRDRKDRAVAGILIVNVGTILLMFVALRSPGQEPSPMDSFLHATLYTMFIPMFAYFASNLAGDAKQRFTMPATSWTLAGWPAFHGMVTVAGCYLILGWLANWYDAQWPLVKPAAFAACTFVLAHGLGCLLSGSEKWHPLAAFFLSLLVCVATFGFNHHTFEQHTTPYWSDFAAWEVFALLIATAGGFLLSVASFSLARQGRAWSLADIALRMLEKLEFRRSEVQRFRSPRESQCWMEWRRKGYSLAAVSAVVAIPLAVWFSTGYPYPKDFVPVIGGFAMMGTMAMPLWGMFLGGQGEQFDIKEFIAVRPLTDTELADIVLLNTAKTLLLGWSVWCVGVGLALGCAFLAGVAPATPQDVLGGDFPGGTWTQAGQHILAIAFAVALGSWTLASLGVVCILLRSWLLLTFVLIGIGLPASVVFAFPNPIPVAAVAGLQLAYASAVIGGTLFSFVTAWRLQLIAAKRAAVCAGVCVVLLVGALLFLRLDTSEPLTYRIMQLSNCVLPITALAATPLAVWWNRHR